MDSFKKVLPLILVAILFAGAGYFIGKGRSSDQGASVYKTNTLMNPCDNSPTNPCPDNSGLKAGGSGITASGISIWFTDDGKCRWAIKGSDGQVHSGVLAGVSEKDCHAIIQRNNNMNPIKSTATPQPANSTNTQIKNQ